MKKKLSHSIGPASPIRILPKTAGALSGLVTSIYLLSIALVAEAAPARRSPTIVLDPGHGGQDLGTIVQVQTIKGRKTLREKDVTLELAQLTAALLIQKGYTVILTRNDDRELDLGSRTALANRLRADAFISLHMNSTPHSEHGAHRDAQGIETYILNTTSDSSSKRLAQLENSVLGRTAENDASLPGEVALILRDLRLDANLPESKRLACSVQKTLVEGTSPLAPVAPAPGRSRNRGVKQALFHVLLGADMPSVLVEMGFLTHPQDQALVQSDQGKQAMSRSIAGAIQRFFRVKGTELAQAELSRCQVHEQSRAPAAHTSLRASW